MAKIIFLGDREVEKRESLIDFDFFVEFRCFQSHLLWSWIYYITFFFFMTDFFETLRKKLTGVEESFFYSIWEMMIWLGQKSIWTFFKHNDLRKYLESYFVVFISERLSEIGLSRDLNKGISLESFFSEKFQ